MLPVLDQQPFIDVRSLLEVRAEILDRRQAELVLCRLLPQLLMVLHHLRLIVPLVRRLEEDPGLELGLRAEPRGLLRLRVLAEGVEAAGLVDVHVFVHVLCDLQ